jgi:hypothetical protein
MRGARRFAGSLGLASVLALAALSSAASPALAAETNCSIASNPIVCENALPGDPASDWQVQGAGDSSIQGYATSMSVNVGQTESFKIDTSASSYHIDILRLGYYGGDGARLIASNIKLTATLPQKQPACLTSSSTGLIDCGNWGVSASWTVPSTAVSGVYIAHLVRNDTGGDSQIPFVVRNDASKSEILLQTSDATWEAYNDYGGNSLYTCTVACPPGEPEGYKAAYAVSYNRPFDGSFATDGGSSYLYYAEYQLMYWLEENGYNVSYTSEAEVDNNGALLKNHKVFVSSGHDEYWSAGQRASVEAAREAGVNLAFFSGNEIFWKTRWGPSTEGSNTPYRTLTTYKETHFNAPVDPNDPPTWTGSWRDPRFSPPADGGKPENALTGQDFLVNAGTSDITVPSQYSKLRLWRNTAASKLTSGQTLTLAPGSGTLGYEWDEDVDNGFRPSGEFDLSSTTVSGLETFKDYGSNTSTNTTATHHLTLYKAHSGALVFGAGTVQWSWGLANVNAWESDSTEPSNNPPDPNMEQATVNLFADMGAQPGTLISGLIKATQSTDTTPPTSTITSPASGANLQDGSQVTISGTATDAGGGVVAGVEVSTDGGSTWHPATLTTPAEQSVKWSYAWVAHGNPTTTIKSRAVDDSANLETPSAGKVVNVSCPCSIWGAGVTPATPDSGDTSSTEVGVKFTSEVFGTVSGIRFYKAATNTGTHIGSLWTASGTLLASATFTNETASGWQQVNFSSPIAIMPNTTYVAAYLAPNGHYAATNGYFYTPPPVGGNALNSPPLHAVAASNSSINGLYSYSTTSTFPSSTYNAANYYVDVAFSPAPAPGTATGVSATAGTGSATVSWSAPSSGGPVSTYTITPYIGSTAQTPTTVSGSPPATSTTISGLTAGTAYTFKVQASNPAGSGPLSSPSNAVTPTAATAPGAPSGVSASPATAQALVSWTAPSSNGGSVITGYTITPYIGSTAQTPAKASATATSTTVTGLTNGTGYTFTVTATNAIGTSPASSASNAATPQNTIFDFATPTTIDSGDTSSTEVGVKFTSEAGGSITGIRFYKAAANTGTHIGSLWSSSGTLLAQATFANETASGWQQVNFSTPVEITAGTTYVAAYLAPNGHYSATSAGFSTAGVNNPPLHALANTTSANGVYAYSSTSTFPSSTFNSTNYYVDALFTASPPPGQVTGVNATAGPGSATVSWTAPSSGGHVTSYVVTPYSGSTAQTPVTVSGTLPASPPTSTTISGLTPGTAYTFKVQATNASGAGTVSTASSSVTPTALTAPGAPSGISASAATTQALVSWTAPSSNGGSAITGYTITPYIGSTAQTSTQASASTTSTAVTGLTNGTGYTFTVTATNAIGTSPASSASNAATPQNTIFDFATPTTIDSGDPGSVELGVKFTSDVNGTVTGVRFYKAATNTGTHIGSLWSSSGTLLAQATFTNETASGWQQVNFSNPISITAGTTYVAAYLAPNGHYSAAASAFSSAATNNPPLHALANTTSPDGVYSYSSTSTFPSNNFNATNYYVDVLFSATLTPGQVTGVSATAGAGSATISWSAPSSGGPVTTYTITPHIGSTALAATTVSGSPLATSTRIEGLAGGTSYTFTVQASSSIGSGPASSPSSAVTPTAATAPLAPTGVSAASATNQASVSWTAPSDDGGKPITGYVVTPYVDSTAQTPVQASASATAATATGLSNGTNYTFTVAATNALGTSPASNPSSTVTPQDTIFDFATPTTIDSGDTSSIELGVNFTSDLNGWVTGIRFYKAQANTGTHIGSLWTASGTLLAQATFTSESASGWQQVNFSTPVEITAGTTYVAAYLAPNGHYSATSAAFGSAGVNNPPLHALANTTTPDGLYTYSPTSTLPLSSFNATNYYVDVLFTATPTPGQVTGVSATAGAGSATVSWSAPSSGGSVAKYTVTPYIGSTAQTPVTVSGSPPVTNTTISGLASSTTYTFKVQASNSNGPGPISSPSNAVTTATVTPPSPPAEVSASPGTSQALVSWTPSSNGGSAITEYTVTPYIGSTAQTPVQASPSSTSATITGLTNGNSYTFTVTATNTIGTSQASNESNTVTPEDTIFDFATPTTVDSGDTSSTEVGVNFTSDVNGWITGIRFYKAATNTGTHIGSLWSSSGTLLAQTTFTNETASGWQQVNFSTPVEITAGTTYVAAYLAPNGHYSATSAAFGSAGVNNPPLRALANTTTPDGLYSYSAISAFPSSSFNATNYYVDVLFKPAS